MYIYICIYIIIYIHTPTPEWDVKQLPIGMARFAARASGRPRSECPQDIWAQTWEDHDFGNGLPSGKRLHNELENQPFYSRANQRNFDWAIFNSFLYVYQRVNSKSYSLRVVPRWNRREMEKKWRNFAEIGPLWSILESRYRKRVWMCRIIIIMTAGFFQPEWVSFIFSRLPCQYMYPKYLPKKMVLDGFGRWISGEWSWIWGLHGEFISIPKTELISRPPHKEHCDQRSRQNHYHPGAVGMCPLLPNQTMGNSQKKKLLISSHGNAIPKFADDLPLKTLEDGPISGIDEGVQGVRGSKRRPSAETRRQWWCICHRLRREVELFSDLKEAVLCWRSPRIGANSMDQWIGLRDKFHRKNTHDLHRKIDGFRLRKKSLSQSIGQPNR